MLPPGRFFHVGYAVPNLESAMADLAEMFGLEWAAISERSATIQDPQYGLIEAEFRVAYSTTGPPHVEVIQSITPTMWTTDSSYLHHLGMWARDIEADSATLERRGMPRYAHGVSDDGGLRFVFHRNPYGPLIELLPLAARPRFEQWMRGTV
jgi:hypothetical protein